MREQVGKEETREPVSIVIVIIPLCECCFVKLNLKKSHNNIILNGMWTYKGY